MIEERARVVSVNGGEVWVETVRSSACGACSAKSGCGQELMHKLGGNRALHIKIHYSGSVKPGDQVVLGLEEGVFLKSSLLIYGLPLFTFILAIIGGDLLLQWSELWVAAAGLLGLLLGFILLWFHNTIFSLKPSSEPVILRVLATF